MTITKMKPVFRIMSVFPLKNLKKCYDLKKKQQQKLKVVSLFGGGDGTILKQTFWKKKPNLRINIK